MLEQISTLATALMLALLIVAVVSDMRSHRIPNWIVGCVLGLGIVMQCADRGWSGLGLAVAGASLGLILFLPFYARRAMGAGDVKLMAAAGAWLGPLGALLACAVTLVAGMVLALLALVGRLSVAQRLGPMLADALPAACRPRGLTVESQGQLKIPYAAAIVTGVAVVGWYLNKFAALLGLVN